MSTCLQCKSLNCKSCELLNEFSDIFSDSSADLGLINPKLETEHVIDKGNADPFTQVPYQLSHYEERFLKEQLDSLLVQGCIRPSSSPWLSPTVLIKKKDKTLRLCIDYRALNKVTLRDPYPLPLINTLLGRWQAASILHQWMLSRHLGRSL